MNKTYKRHNPWWIHPLGKNYFLVDQTKKFISPNVYIPVDERRTEKEPEKELPQAKQEPQPMQLKKRTNTCSNKDQIHCQKKKKSRKLQHSDIFTSQVGFGKHTTRPLIISPLESAILKAKRLITMRRRKCKKKACKQRGARSKLISVRGRRKRRKGVNRKNKTKRCKHVKPHRKSSY